MGAFKVPDAPTLERADPGREVSPVSMSRDTADGQDFVPRTVRAVGIVAAIGVVMIAGTGRYGLILPFVTGVALGTILLAGFELVVRKAFTPDTVLADRGVPAPGGSTEPRPKKFGGKAAILWFALIKYPAVAFLIYWITRNWSQTQILTFVGGFILLQLIIGLRGLGAFLSPQTKRK